MPGPLHPAEGFGANHGFRSPFNCSLTRSLRLSKEVSGWRVRNPLSATAAVYASSGVRSLCRTARLGDELTREMRYATQGADVNLFTRFCIPARDRGVDVVDGEFRSGESAEDGLHGRLKPRYRSG